MQPCLQNVAAASLCHRDYVKPYVSFSYESGSRVAGAVETLEYVESVIQTPRLAATHGGVSSKKRLRFSAANRGGSRWLSLSAGVVRGITVTVPELAEFHAGNVGAGLSGAVDGDR